MCLPLCAHTLALGGCLSRGRMVLPFSSNGHDFPGRRNNRLSYLRLQVNGLLVSCARHYLHRAPNAAAPPVTYHRIRDSDVWHLRPLATQEDSDSITGGTRSRASHILPIWLYQIVYYIWSYHIACSPHMVISYRRPSLYGHVTSQYTPLRYTQQGSS